MKKEGRDISTLLGIGIAVGSLIFGYVFEGGYVPALWQVSAFIIILGGTLGATATSYTLKDIASMPHLLREAGKLSPDISKDIMEMLITFSEKARREGLLSLESEIEDLNDNFLKKGLKLAVDGTDPEVIRAVLENEIYLFELRKRDEADMFETAGGFSPTMGIIGTVMGLVLVLSRLGGDAAALGESIAVAFLATFYGIGFANIFWIPIANKLKLKLKKEKLHKELIIIAILSMLAGENPSILRDKLESFLAGKELKEFLEHAPSK
jgi:chemotaxis protein MotA